MKTNNLLLLGAGAAALYFITRRSTSASAAPTTSTNLIPTVDPITAGINLGVPVLGQTVEIISGVVTNSIFDPVTNTWDSLTQAAGNLLDGASNNVAEPTVIATSTEPNFTLSNGTNLLVDQNGIVLTGTYIGMNVADIEKTLTASSAPYTLNLDGIVSALRSVGYSFTNLDIYSGNITQVQRTGIGLPSIQALADIFANPYTKIVDLPFGTIESNVKALFSTIGETDVMFYNPYSTKDATTSSDLRSTFFNYQTVFGSTGLG